MKVVNLCVEGVPSPKLTSLYHPRKEIGMDWSLSLNNHPKRTICPSVLNFLKFSKPIDNLVKESCQGSSRSTR